MTISMENMCIELIVNERQIITFTKMNIKY